MPGRGWRRTRSSGGLRQRVTIAMALSCNPALLIADEPTTSLDVSIQAQILDLIQDLRQTLHLAIIYVSHDLGVIANIADSVLVMYAGRTVESGPTPAVMRSPAHPYTRALLKSVPTLQSDYRKERLQVIPGGRPDLGELPPGCAFAPRCERRQAVCLALRPEYLATETGRSCACHNQYR
jgi:oligopeptide/dipeptide ABC transporter ATP-binding protein